MRVDLGLQGAQLRVSGFAEVIPLVNQYADAPHHEIEAVLQLADLIIAVHDTTYI